MIPECIITVNGYKIIINEGEKNDSHELVIELISEKALDVHTTGMSNARTLYIGRK